MFCHKCGVQIRPGSLFCHNCGTQVEQEKESSEKVRKSAVRRSFWRKNEQMLLWIGAVLFFVIVCAFSFKGVFRPRSGGESVSHHKPPQTAVEPAKNPEEGRPEETPEALPEEKEVPVSEPEPVVPAVLKTGDRVTVSGVVQYDNSPSDLGNENCSIAVQEKFSYVYEDMDGGENTNEYHMYYISDRSIYPEDITLMKKYIGQQVTISGEFSPDCHGIPFLVNIQILSGAEKAGVFNTGYAAYDEKLEEYAAALAMSEEEFNLKYDYGNDCSSINATVLSYTVDELKYSLFDVDQNGVPELFIEDYGDLIEFCMLKDGQVVRPIQGDSFGYRAHLSVLSDGRLQYSGSSGAASGSSKTYRIGDDGASLVMEEAYYFDEMLGRNEYMEPEYTFVTLDELHEIWERQAPSCDLGNWTWTPVQPAY